MFSVFLDQKANRNLQQQKNPKIQIGSYCYSISYEPHWAKVGDYTFDFSLIEVIDRGPGYVPFTKISIFEYKPSETTKAYKQKFCERCWELYETNTRLYLDFYLYEVNFFEKQSSGYYFFGPDQTIEPLSKYGLPTVEDFNFIRSIRFDLVQP
jgi:hypothetical protein